MYILVKNSYTSTMTLPCSDQFASKISTQIKLVTNYIWSHQLHPTERKRNMISNVRLNVKGFCSEMGCM